MFSRGNVNFKSLVIRVSFPGEKVYENEAKSLTASKKNVSSEAQ